MDQLYRLFEYLITGIIENTYLPYFFALLFMAEGLKSLTVPLPGNTVAFRFDTQHKVKFLYRYFVFVLGLALMYPMILLQDPMTLEIRPFLIKLGTTYAVTTSFYELISALIFKKLRQLLGVVKDAEIKPMVIDPNDMMSGGFGSYPSSYDASGDTCEGEATAKDTSETDGMG